MLKFHAKADLLVNVPGVLPSKGQPVRRVGRKFIPAKKDAKGVVIEPASYPATKEPHECEADSPAACALAKQCRRGVLYAADRETAEYCQVDFVDIELKDGAWGERAPVAVIVEQGKRGAKEIRDMAKAWPKESA